MKVKVSKDLYKALKTAEEEVTISNIAESIAKGYIFESDLFKIFNTLSYKELMEIYDNGYDLEEPITANEILNNVQNILASQTAKGFEKYGEYVKAENLTVEQWIDHTCEELVDTLVYLQALKERL